MPASRAILSSISENKLDPTKPHDNSSLTKRQAVKTESQVLTSKKVKKDVVQEEVLVQDVQVEEVKLKETDVLPLTELLVESAVVDQKSELSQEVNLPEESQQDLAPAENLTPKSLNKKDNSKKSPKNVS